MGLPLSNDGKPVPSQLTVVNALIPKGAKNVEVAKDFLKYFIQPQINNNWLKVGLGRNIPVMPASVKRDPWWLADPHRKAYTELGVLGPTLPAYWSFNPAYAEVQTAQIWSTAWADVIRNGMTPQAAAEKAGKKEDGDERSDRRSVLRGSLACRGRDLGATLYRERRRQHRNGLVDPGFVPEEDAAFRKIVADYEKASGNTIDYSLVPFAPLMQKIVSAITSGDVPDLISHDGADQVDRPAQRLERQGRRCYRCRRSPEIELSSDGVSCFTIL